MYSDSKIGKSLIRRVISESKASSELTWHRDRRDRIVLVVEGAGWKFQRDNEVPKPIARGDILTVSANEWHRIIPGTGNLVVVIKEGEKKPEKLLIDLIGEMSDEGTPLDLDGTELVYEFQTASIEDEENSMLVSEDDLLEAVIMLREAKKKKNKVNPDYLTKDAGEMRDEIRKNAKKSDDDPSAYTSHPKGGWKADYDEKGRPYKTKPSSSTLAFKKRFGESDDIDEELLEELSAKVIKALKNKAEKAHAPLGALKTVYRKGMAAWKTGHKPGANQNAWAMGRVNSFLVGGKARKVDAAQWKQVQQHRKKTREIDQLDESFLDVLVLEDYVSDLTSVAGGVSWEVTIPLEYLLELKEQAKDRGIYTAVLTSLVAFKIEELIPGSNDPDIDVVQLSRTPGGLTRVPWTNHTDKFEITCSETYQRYIHNILQMMKEECIDLGLEMEIVGPNTRLWTKSRGSNASWSDSEIDHRKDIMLSRTRSR